MKRKRSGFTIVELLVVIGVIAVLFSILIPVVVRARQQARIVQCMSQLRQLGQITASYIADNKGWIFPCQYDQTSGPPVIPGRSLAGSVGQLNPDILNYYLHLTVYNPAISQWVPNNGSPNRGILTCPDTNTLTDTSQGLLTYGCNESVHVLYQFDGNIPERKLKRLSQIHRPGEIMTMGDATQGSAAYTSSGYLVYTSDDFQNPVSAYRQSFSELDSIANGVLPADVLSGWNQQGDVVDNYHARYRHGKLATNPVVKDAASGRTITYVGTVGFCNYLFLDGHVESLGPGQLRCKNIATWY